MNLVSVFSVLGDIGGGDSVSVHARSYCVTSEVVSLPSENIAV